MTKIIKKEWLNIEPLAEGGARALSIGWQPTEIIVGFAGLIGLCLALDCFGPEGGFFILLPMGLITWKRQSIDQAVYNELLEYYATEVYKPIFIWSESPTDPSVVERAESHRRLLEESGNTLYAAGKIYVKEGYFQDPLFDFCETWEEYELRRSDTIKDDLRTWAKGVSKADENWRKQILHGQRMDGSEVLTA